MTKYIIISGIDGSGKTTIINELTKILSSKGYSVSYIWMRYNHYLVKYMHALARVLGLSMRVSNEMGNIWEHHFYKNKIFCKVYILCSYIDNFFAKKKVSKMKTDFVICDRWINDILIDLGSETRFMNILNSKWYDRFHKFLPENSLQFIIFRNKEQVLDCRLENRLNPAFNARYVLYNEIARKEDIILIDNSGTVEMSINQILDKLQ